LTSGKGTDHDETGAHTGEETLDTELSGHGDQTRHDRLSGETLGLVDLGEEGVGGLRDDGSGHTGDQTGREVKTGRLGTSEAVLGLSGEAEDLLGRNLEAGDISWAPPAEEGTTYTANLAMVYGTCLNRMGPKLATSACIPPADRHNIPSVETTDTLLSSDPGESTKETVGESWLGDESDTGSLEGAKGNVGKELGDTRGSEVDGLTVLTGSVDTEVVDGSLLPEFVTEKSARLHGGIRPDAALTLRTSGHPGASNRER
jgi:hypothetical protein